MCQVAQFNSTLKAISKRKVLIYTMEGLDTCYVAPVTSIKGRDEIELQKLFCWKTVFQLGFNLL